MTPDHNDSVSWLGDDESILKAIRKLEQFANAGLGTAIEIDGHTGIRASITSRVSVEGETIYEAVEAACAEYAKSASACGG